MLNITALNSHTTGVCKKDEQIICSFNADMFNSMLNNITVSGMFTKDFIENIEAVKKDFGDFCDYLLTLMKAQETEEELPPIMPDMNESIETEEDQNNNEEGEMKETPIV